MDKKALLKMLARQTAVVWAELCELYPQLVRFDEPKLELNPYTWRTAGSCFQTENRIQLGYKFFRDARYFETMVRVILPHELIHQADYNIFGESEKICGHGEKWREMMVNYGLPAEPYHSMEITR
jgi:predicted SprT family Zn-dependent metalloprotease